RNVLELVFVEPTSWWPGAFVRDHEQVLEAVLRRPVGWPAVGPGGEVEEVTVECRDPIWPVGDGLVGRHHRAEGLFEQLNVPTWGRGPLGVIAAGQLEELDPLTEQLAHVVLAAPECRRRRPRRRRRRVGRKRLQKVGEQALRGE